MNKPDQRWRLIVHGKSAGDDLLREAVEAMRARGIRLSVRVTWEDGDAERYVAEALDDGVNTVIAAGGDGTLSEVATTLAHRDESADALPSLGLVPMGTANDFASAALIPATAQDAFELIASTAPHAIDLLRLVADAPADGAVDARVQRDDGAHWVANLASGGFGTQVTVETSEGLKSMLGGLAYVLTGISRLGRIEPIRARIHGPEFAWEGGFIALGIGNGRQAGGGQGLCPDALVDDGQLDVTVIPDLSGEVGAMLATLVAEGQHAALERVATRARLPWVEIASELPMTLNLDGEPVESTRFRIDCVPARVRMHLPPGCPLLGPR